MLSRLLLYSVLLPYVLTFKLFIIKDCMVLLSQVVSADTGCGKMLGFLPRELAQYLSPLIEKFCLSFEVIYFLNWKESCLNFCASFSLFQVSGSVFYII
jgi:hypothetical protein